MLVSTSQKRSPVNSCGLDVKNAFDVQIPVCKSHKVLGIVINETLDRTAQINDVAKRINYSLFIFKKIKPYCPLKARIAYIVMVMRFRILTTAIISGVVQIIVTVTKS